MLILSGTAIAETILSSLEKRSRGKGYRLAVLLREDDPVARLYVEKKKEAAKRLGIDVVVHGIASGISQNEIQERITILAKDEGVTGIIVQLPLPRGVQAQEILDRIPPEKDPDVLSSAAFGAFALRDSAPLPPTVAAVNLLLQEQGVVLRGCRTLVVGSGRLVGLPSALWLMRQGASVSVANRDTQNLNDLTLAADLIVSGAGSPGLLTAKNLKKGVVVIDAGASEEDGKVRGDLDTSGIEDVVAAYTPVPGGVGPLTVACLLSNLVDLGERQVKN